MDRRRMIGLALLGALGLAGQAWGGGELCRMQEPEGLIAHEWGTFTSFSAPNGELIPMRLTVTESLPDFVMTPRRQAGDDEWYGAERVGKQTYRARQRMETPVIYFYTPKEMRVDVKVDFPKGLCTEFYPPVTSFAPAEAGTGSAIPPVRGGSLTWSGVTITPPKLAKQTPPAIEGTSHYAIARGVEPAAIVGSSHNGQTHAEKFLFYRGLGEFELPLKARALGGGRVIIEQSRKEALPYAVLLSVDQGRVRWSSVRNAMGTSELALKGESGSREDLERELTRALHAQGIFELEASTMVATWRDSWLAEEGTRVLCVLPAGIVDELLPLSVTPAPKETKRAFVARMELLTPETLAQVRSALAELNPGAGRPQPDEGEVECLVGERAKLGRFTPSAIEHARANPVAPDAARTNRPASELTRR